MTGTVKLGYIGLGNMGAPMAERLVDWPGGATVYDISTEAMTLLAKRVRRWWTAWPTSRPRTSSA